MIIHRPTLTKLWRAANLGILLARREELSWHQGITTAIYDNMLSCDSMEYDFDVGRDLWLTKGRFYKLAADYIELGYYEEFLDKCKAIHQSKRGPVVQMTCRLHGMTGSGGYKHGNCMIGITYRYGAARDRRPVLGLHSRVTDINFIGGLDLALMHVIAREIGAEVGVAVEDIGFRWHLDAMQWSALKGIPFIHSSGFVDKVLPKPLPNKDYPSLNVTRATLRGIQQKYEDGTLQEAKFGPRIRFHKRYQEYRDGQLPQPHVSLAALNLDRLRERGGRQRTNSNLDYEERFWHNVIRKGVDECWPWIGGQRKNTANKEVRGFLERDGKRIAAHRASFEIHHGPIPEGLWVLHRCDVGLCVNPKHLFLGTSQDNIQDRVTKGRSRGGRKKARSS